MSLVLALSLSGCDPREWFVCAIGACGVVLDGAAPRAPTGLTATPGDGRVVPGWRGNTEPDLFY